MACDLLACWAHYVVSLMVLTVRGLLPLQVGDLFLPTATASGSTLLQSKVTEDDLDASELYFGAASGMAGSSNSPEAEAWQQRCAVFRQQLAPLTQTEVCADGSACEW